MNLNGTKKSIRGKIKNPKIDPNSTHEVRSEINETLKTQSKYNVEVYVQVSMLYVVLVNKKNCRVSYDGISTRNIHVHVYTGILENEL